MKWNNKKVNSLLPKEKLINKMTMQSHVQKNNSSKFKLMLKHQNKKENLYHLMFKRQTFLNVEGKGAKYHLPNSSSNLDIARLINTTWVTLISNLPNSSSLNSKCEWIWHRSIIHRCSMLPKEFLRRLSTSSSSRSSSKRG